MHRYRIDHLLTALIQGTLILTPNRRIAESIRASWATQQHGQILAPPNIHALHDWLDAVAHRASGHLPDKRFDTAETQWLWQRVTASLGHGLLMSDEAIAGLFSSADDLLQRWCLDYRDLPNDPDSHLLKRAIAAYEKALSRQRAIDTLRTQHRLLALFSARKMAAPARIVLTGFDEIDPLHQRILDACGAEVQALAPSPIATQASSVACEDDTQEILAAARWAKQQLNAGKNRIGIIVPDIHQRRAIVERTLFDVFAPHHALPQISRSAAPFNLSASDTLEAQPVIRCALALLRLNHPEMTLQDCLFLLHSAFWSDFFAEQTRRIAAEICLRDLQREALTLTDFAEALPTGSTLRERIQRLQMPQRHRAASRYPSEWITLFQQQLLALGWPGQRQLDRIETMHVQQLQGVFDQLMRMDDLCGKLDHRDMLALLHVRCRNTDCHTGADDSPVQVLGVTEGSGLHFDALWICGMGERKWPPAPKPHPLLPLALQITARMPHSSVSREQAYCARLAQDMLDSAADTVVSFSAVTDESQQRISSLFAGLPAKNPDDVVPGLLNPAQHPCFAARAALEWLHDAQGPAFTDSKARGGHPILKAQAANPFDAFAQFRLQVKPLSEPSIGLPASERGNLIHSSLQSFWRQTKDSHSLCALDASALQSRIHDCVDDALRRNDHPALQHEVFRTIEKNQLRKHLVRWLELEKQREPFAVIATEKQIQYRLCDVVLSLAIDRIDRLEDGSLLLVDYKTSSMVPGVSSWIDQRPAEPQLPLYSLATEGCAAIAFAQVNLHTMRWVGLGKVHDPLLVKNKSQLSPEAWQAQQAAWQGILQALMAEFKNGVARVQYRNGKVPDYSTHWQALNRWPEKDEIDAALQISREAE